MRTSALALALFTFGCAGAAPRSSPAPTVERLAAALRARDPGAVAAITGRSPDEARAADALAGAELATLGEALSLAPLEPAARVTLDDGSTVVLVQDGESWRVDRGVLGRPALARPEDAVMALHAALVRSRIAGLVTLLARAPRTEASAELTRWIEATADPDALEVSVQGDTAVVLTPTGEHIELVRESGEWRLVDLR